MSKPNEPWPPPWYPPPLEGEYWDRDQLRGPAAFERPATLRQKIIGTAIMLLLWALMDIYYQATAYGY